ncbi:mucin-17 [Biomphalaria glabrata]|uniref:Serine-rich adhesin for platelets-like n=1 Tax=Biomphalaria glabrata TaxID=6526 RepID=A0A9U8DUF2_BIOGL|nr:serine-rich adhesin for platelets-like [Biomphalaria glabrata]XP_013061265.2 serine-rich adhesin for platelets-like [Biomphalaria glabrata]KAI8729513.1 mucin-17 [Biomphalaria glabrata]
MDGGDGTGFPFASGEFNKGAESTDISWGDMFLDGIHSDDPNSSDAGVIVSEGTNIGTAIHGTAHMVQQQPNVIGGQVQVHIPTHLQGSLGNNTVQHVNSGTVTYLTPSGTAHVSTASRLQNVLPAAAQVTASIGQAQNNAKLVQIAPSFPMTQVQQLNSVPMTLLQPTQTLTGQTIYGGQGTAGLFSGQGSVHIENPKVVNVNFGPHLIGSDSSGQQAIIQTAEGKRVLITNSQLQHMPQSISLSQLPVGTHLINPGAGNVIRASMAPGTTGTRQILLHNMPRQASAQPTGLTKNVVLNPGISPVIYQSGQSGQLLQSHPTLITSGTGLQVVNTGGNQGNQVQLIAQPSMNQCGMGQQLSQSTIMNFINNQSGGSQIAGLVPGQNIFVNGQMLNIGQIGGLTMSQLQVQPNSQGGVTLANLNTNVNRSAQFQPTTQHLVIQSNGQQQIMLQPNNASPSLVTSTAQRLNSSIQGGKAARAPTPNANSASSTPVATPTPSTPTPTPTPDLSDYGGQGSKMNNILEQALQLSDIDLQSFEDEDYFKLLDNSSTTSVQPEIPTPPVKTKPQSTLTKSKSTKSKSKTTQPVVSVPNSTISFQNTKAPFQTSHGQKVTLSSDQQIISNGQVYVVSANGQQLILQQQVKGQVSSADVSNSISSISQRPHIVNRQSNQSTDLSRQFKQNQNIPVPLAKEEDDKVFTSGSVGNIATSSSPILPVSSSPHVYSRPSTQTYSNANISPLGLNQAQVKNQKITTLAGTFLKQEPLVQTVKQEFSIANVKQEPVSEIQVSISESPTFSQQVSSYNHVAVTTSNVMTASLPVITSSVSSLTANSTSTTQSHQATIMTSSFNSQQTSSVHPSSVSCETSTVFTTAVFTQALSSPTFSSISTCSKPASALKEKDPSSVKVMTPIKIANSTLMLSLTPIQKKRLEDHLSNMSLKEQNDFLTHQQNIIRRSQQVQQKQLEQQQKYQQQQKLQQQNQIPQQLQQNQIQQQLPQSQNQQQFIQNQVPQQFQQNQVPQQFQQNQVPQQFQQNQVPQQFQQNQAPQQFQQNQAPQQFQQNQASQGFQQNQGPQQFQLNQGHQQRQQMQTQMSASQSLQQSQSVSGQTPLQENMRQYSNHSNTVDNTLSTCATGVTSLTSLPATVQELMDKPEDNQLSFQEQTQQVRHPIPVPQAPPQPAPQMQTSLQQTYVYPSMGRCLAEQQLLRDRTLALGPDVNSPFKSLSDAMRRLVRYHTLQDHKPEEGSKQMRKWDTKYFNVCDYLIKKKRRYMKRFHKMKLFHDMCPEKSPEYIQNLLCFNEQLQDVINSEKEQAKNSPESFEPLQPGLCSQSFKTEPPDSDKLSELDPVPSVDLKFNVDKRDLKKFDVKLDRPELDIKSEKSESPYESPSGHKRKLTEKSSGTLKFVFKRRTTDKDKFIVKNSFVNQETLPEDLKPVVNLEKSDSEYEYDSHSAVTNNQPVIVRRRTSSVSRQTSYEAGSSEGSSSNSNSSKVERHFSYEEVESSQDEDDEEDEDKNTDEPSEDDADIQEEEEEDQGSQEERTHSKGRHRVSFGDSVEEINSDDAFMEPFESGGPHKHSGSSQPKSNIFETFGETNSNLKKNSHSSSLSGLKSNLTYPNSNCSVGSGNIYSEKRPHSNQFSYSANDTPGTFRQSALQVSPLRQKEGMLNSSCSTTHKGEPIFTTPNKSLLQTSAMFNSSDDEDDNANSSQRISSFEIDNKDPQNSMINDSVRSAINSVLNQEDNDDSQSSWSSSARRTSSSARHSLFHSASPAATQSRDADLDAAVQSIMND